MKDSTYAYMCTIMLGTATMLRFVGYDTAMFSAESVLHSAHARTPDQIVSHSGYYGMAVKELAGCIATLFVPCLMGYIHAKWAIVMGAMLFTTFISSFLYIHNFVYFPVCALLGIGYTLNYVAFSAYQMEFSTKENLARNTARVWGIADFSKLIGALIYICVAEEVKAGTTQKYRYYGEEETRLMYGVFTALSLVALCIYLALPTRRLKNSVASNTPRLTLSMKHHLMDTAKTLVNPSVLLLLPRSIYYGFFVSFYMNVFPTTLQFSSILSTAYPLMTAYYAISVSAGGASAAFLMGPLESRIKDFGMRPLVVIGALINLTMVVIVVLSTPIWATVAPTGDTSLVLEPSIVWVLIIGFLNGLIASAHNSSTLVISSRLIPGKTAHVYSAARFYFAISSAVIFFISPYLNIVTYGCILFVTCTAGAVGFHFAGRRVERREAHEGKHEQATPDDVEQIVERNSDTAATINDNGDVVKQDVNVEAGGKKVVGLWHKIRPLTDEKEVKLQKF